MRIAASMGFDSDFAKLIDEANKDCLGCTIGKGRVKLPKSTPLDHKSAAGHFNDRISLDYIVKFGPWLVLVILDDFSRFVKTICLEHRDKERTLEAFRSHWEAEFHLPRRHRHDNDNGFVDLDSSIFRHPVS